MEYARDEMMGSLIGVVNVVVVMVVGGAQAEDQAITAVETFA